MNGKIASGEVLVGSKFPGIRNFKPGWTVDSSDVTVRFLSSILDGAFVKGVFFGDYLATWLVEVLDILRLCFI